MSRPHIDVLSGRVAKLPEMDVDQLVTLQGAVTLCDTIITQLNESIVALSAASALMSQAINRNATSIDQAVEPDALSSNDRVTPAEVALELNVKLDHLRFLWRSGKFPRPHKLIHRAYFYRSEIEAWKTDELAALPRSTRENDI